MKRIYTMLFASLLFNKVQSQKLEAETSKDSSNIADRINVFKDQFTVTPNPVGDVITVHYDKANKLSVIKVFNLLGEQVYRGPMNNVEERIDLSDQEKGVYFVEINTDGKKLFKRVVKL